MYSIQPLRVTYNSSGPGKDDVQVDDKSACCIIMWQGISKFKEGLCKVRMEFSPLYVFIAKYQKPVQSNLA